MYTLFNCFVVVFPDVQKKSKKAAAKSSFSSELTDTSRKALKKFRYG